ncbi:hypothetical protein F0919_10490 [Taibaiella lutea]|uniref:Lipoprotein n=1 Tax=Taibaiella lutea TaxID=2608001 RepID=A0A5M6CJ15_9BACT|nr:hypothetical protein [Taibaiella lutea]KAA5535017.1 hypothetical protein F0919_10490 [Taibaiella lutea]
MKKILIVVVSSYLVLTSCSKATNKNAIVVRDCTGTYLQIDGKDYQVCNLEKVAAFQDRTAVTATYKKLAECNGSAKDAIVCMMLHSNEGWIEVTDIK